MAGLRGSTGESPGHVLTLVGGECPSDPAIRDISSLVEGVRLLEARGSASGLVNVVSAGVERRCDGPGPPRSISSLVRKGASH